MKGQARRTNEEIAEFCRQHGCVFVKHLAEKGRTRIEYFCRCGKVAQAYWSNFIRYPNCWECGKKKKSGSNCYMWNPDRQAIADAKKFRKKCSNALARCLKATGQEKVARTSEMIGYTPQELQDHIYNHPEYREGMDFEIDHIFPIQAFVDHGIHDLKLINCLENLRPLEGDPNRQKADKYDGIAFQEWIKQKTNS